MEIINTKDRNIANTGTLLVTKSIGSLIVASTLPFAQLTTEKIKIEIERANGSNFEITKGNMSLKDFILLTTYNDDAITADQNYALTAECEICEGGSIQLNEKDVIRIELTGLKTAETYVLNGIEEPATSHAVLSFEQKSMSSDDTNKIFQVHGHDLAILDKHSSIEEVAYTFDNGQVVKYTLFELSVLSRAIDPVAYVKADGTVQSGFADKLQLPLFGVDAIEIRKSQGALINLILRKEA